MKRSTIVDTGLFAWLPLMFFLAFGIAALANTDRATPHQQSQSLTVTATNPNTYLLGEILDGTVRNVNDVILTHIHIVPFGMTEASAQDITFCDNQVEKFRGKGVFVVLTYDKTKHRKDCYDLFSVHAVYKPNGSAGTTTP